MAHTHHGVDLRGDWARDTLENLYKLWRRPVGLATKVEERSIILRFDGTDHEEKPSDLLKEL